ncbi:MAG: hypothetical protein Fues2KO_04200 [Fuerstiella sp.]
MELGPGGIEVPKAGVGNTPSVPAKPKREPPSDAELAAVRKMKHYGYFVETWRSGRMFKIDTVGLKGGKIVVMPIRNFDLTPLRDCEEITEAGLTRFNITDPYLAGLNGARIEKLSIDRCPNLTDAAFPPLAGVKGLKELRLGGPRVTAAALASLSTLTELEKLIVSGRGFTDDSVDAIAEHLRPIRSLKELWTAETLISGEGRRRLGELLPNVELL